MRAAILLALGLFIGIVATVMTLGALRQATPFHQGLMSVMAHHLGSLRAMGEPDTPAEACDSDRVGAHLAMLRLAGDDLEAAFLPTMNDERFRQYASNYRDALDAAVAQPADSCDAAVKQAASLGDTCSACHRDFR
jgi:cytochrome c556